MNTYVITFHRTYEINAESEEEAVEKAYVEFDTDMKLGLTSSNSDDFSYTTDPINDEILYSDKI